MRKRLALVPLLVIVLLMGLLFNLRVYAYNFDWFLLRWLEARREAVKLYCAGFILAEEFTEDVKVRGYNVLCKDSFERSVYEHVRVSIVAKSPGVTIYRAIVFFYVNTGTDLVVDVVVEKPLSRNQLIIVLENRYTLVHVNTSTVARIRMNVQPGEHYYSVTFILHAVKPGRENFRAGFYIGVE